MEAIHIDSAAPVIARGKDYAPEDFALYCTALSALQWRKTGGRITLCADSVSARFYENAGLCGLWDEVRVCVPDDLCGIDPAMFWAAGKLLALAAVSAPVVMLDTDFIVWQPPEFGDSIIAAHRENLSPNIYPPLGYFKTNGHILPDFSEEVLPLNTAFLYLPDEDFKAFYTAQAIGFMKSAVPCGDTLRYMVFAEQRLLAMCAEFTSTPVETLMEKDFLFLPQQGFTHLWGAKQAMRDDPALRRDFVDGCRERLLKDFPRYAYFAERIDALFAGE